MDVLPVGKIAKKQSEEVRVLFIRHSKYSAMSKIHSYGLLFRRFAHWVAIFPA